MTDSAESLADGASRVAVRLWCGLDGALTPDVG